MFIVIKNKKDIKNGDLVVVADRIVFVSADKGKAIDFAAEMAKRKLLIAGDPDGAAIARWEKGGTAVAVLDVPMDKGVSVLCAPVRKILTW